MKKNKLALGLIFCLFFLWAISSNLLPTMIRQLMKTCELNTFEASFTESAYWLAYFICPIPIAIFMRRFSYRVGIITGLFIAACGGLLFFPAAQVKSYGVYLCIFFIIATGMCFLETAANPYVTVLGDAETAPRRLNLAQSFNGLGAFISAMFLSKLVLSGQNYTRDTIPVDYPGGWEGYIQMETDSMKLPYLILALVLIAVAIMLIVVNLPKVGDEANDDKKDKLIDFSTLKRPHLRWGVIAQFFYNGGQTAINSLFLVYCCTYAGIDEDTATTFFGLYMLAFLVYDDYGKDRTDEDVDILCFGKCNTLYDNHRFWRLCRHLCHAGSIFLHEYHIPHAVFFGTQRPWRPDQVGICLPRNGYRW